MKLSAPRSDCHNTIGGRESAAVSVVWARIAIKAHFPQLLRISAATLPPDAYHLTVSSVSKCKP
jgi:hypothetical protein